MSTRWMAVQYVGDTLRLPIVNKSDMDKPFGRSELEREVRRIVVNPFSDSPQTFVPEADNAKLRELVDALMGCGTRYHTMSGACPMFDANAKDCCKVEEIARKLGVVEVDE